MSIPTKDTQKVADGYAKYVLNTYTRTPMVITKAKGSRIWDVDGKEYLDLFPGWGVSALGYNHPWVMKAVRSQSRKVLHVSNNFYHPGQWRAAKAIVDRSFPGKVFFCNSGAEAIEGAIKFARLLSADRSEIIVAEKSFHGRTYGALSATGQDKPQEGFHPLVPGFVRIPLNDRHALRDKINENTGAVLLEPVQGEGGVYCADDQWLRELRAICDEKKILLILDEIQTGFGRTGQWFAFQHAGVVPDILVFAKAAGGGLPVGAIVIKEALAQQIGPGTHGSTYGGSPLACAGISAVIDAIENQKLLDRVHLLSAYAQRRIQKMRNQVSIVKEVRGRGLMIGIELSVPGQPVVDAAREDGVIINCTQGNVLRLLPAMTITKKQLSYGLTVLEKALKRYAEATQKELA